MSVSSFAYPGLVGLYAWEQCSEAWERIGRVVGWEGCEIVLLKPNGVTDSRVRHSVVLLADGFVIAKGPDGQAMIDRPRPPPTSLPGDG
jgi:hypothetical protein